MNERGLLMKRQTSRWVDVVQNFDLMRSAAVKWIKKNNTVQIREEGLFQDSLCMHIRHPLVSILACEHTHAHTQTHTDSLLGQMASWWGAARSSTEGPAWFVNHDLHASLLLTPDSTCIEEGWTEIRSLRVCVMVCDCGGWGVEWLLWRCAERIICTVYWLLWKFDFIYHHRTEKGKKYIMIHTHAWWIKHYLTCIDDDLISI